MGVLFVKKKKVLLGILAFVLAVIISGPVLAFADVNNTELAAGSLGSEIKIEKGEDNVESRIKDTLASVYNRIIFSIDDIIGKISADNPYFNLSAGGQGIELKLSDKALTGSKTTYQWYSCSDLKKNNAEAIEGATSSSYTTPDFESPEIRYYYCLIKTPVSAVKTRVYQVAYTGIPVVYIETPDGKAISNHNSWLEGATITIDGNGTDYDSLEKTPIRIKGRGNSTWIWPTSKKPYTLKFENSAKVLGMGKNKTWALMANFRDKSLLRNWFASELERTVFARDNMWKTEFVCVDLILNGQYHGNYNIATTIKIGSKRIDIPDISDILSGELKDTNKDGVIQYDDGGFIVELNRFKNEPYNFTTSRNIIFSLKDPDLDNPNDGNLDIVKYIASYIQSVEDVIYSDNFADEETGYASYIDVDSFVDWYIMEELSKNHDGVFDLSTYMYYNPKDKLLHMAPVWDNDIAYGNYMGELAKTENFHVKAGWYVRLFQDPAFNQKVKDRWAEKRDAIFDFANNDLQNKADEIRVSAQLNFQRFRILGHYIWQDPSGFRERKTFQSNVDYLTDFINGRIAWLDSQWLD